MSQQSQSDILQEVSGWTREKCISNLETVLPSVISSLENAAYIEEGIRSFKVLCECLLPCVSGNHLEDRVFSKVNKHVTGLIDGALEKITNNLTYLFKDNSQEEEAASIIEECLQFIQELGACLECCLKYASDCVKTNTATPSIELHLVRSLPECALHYLTQVYRHCKRSNELYGDLLQVTSVALSALFKRAHSVQMLLLNLLDKIIVSGQGLEKDVTTLCLICSSLFKVCSLVTSLDVKLSVSLWKCISRLCTQHLSLLQDCLAVCPFINFLCDEIKQGYHYLFQLSPQPDANSLSQGDDKAFSKSVRIVGFQMKVLVALLRDFADYMGESERSVLDLLLYLHRHLPPSLSARSLPQKQEADVRAHIVNATVPCLTHLMGNRAFRGLLTQDFPEIESEDKLPMLLLQLMVLDVLPKCDDDVLDDWLRPVSVKESSHCSNLLSAIFSSTKQCFVEMNVPVMLQGVVPAGQLQRQVNLYEHTVTHICGMIGAWPARHFKTLETILMSQVCSPCDMLSMMAVDCWCFLARFGTATVCNAQVQSLMSVYKKLLGKRGQPMSGALSIRQRMAHRLGYLLSRLIKFMSPEHLSSLVQQHPPETNISVWLGMRPAQLPPDIAGDIMGRLVTAALSTLSPQGKVKVSHLILSLRTLSEVYNMPKSSADKAAACSSSLSPQQQAKVLQVVTHMWEELQTSFIKSDKQSLLMMSMPRNMKRNLIHFLLPLTAHLLPLMDAKDLMGVLQFVEQVISESDCSIDLAMQAARLVTGLWHVKLGCSYQDSVTKELIPKVFYPLLKHKHPMVHQEALAAFSKYISLTPHEETVPACLMGDEDLTRAVQDYINQVPHQSVDGEFDLLAYLREQQRLMEAYWSKEGAAATQDIVCPSKEELDSEDDLFEQPTKKRKAVIESDEEEIPLISTPLPPLDDSTVESYSPNLLHSTSAAKQAEDVRTKPAVTKSSLSTSETLQHPTDTSASSSDLTKVVSSATPGSETHLKSLLAGIESVTKEILRARETHSNGLPEWFVNDALFSLMSCKNSLKDEEISWLDHLS